MGLTVEQIKSLVSSGDAAKILSDEYGIPSSESGLANLRNRGEGPAYVRIGSRVKYLPDDLAEWAGNAVERVVPMKPVAEGPLLPGLEDA